MGFRDLSTSTAEGGRFEFYDATPQADARVGSLVAEQYRVVERLGKGGMAAVYRAIGLVDGNDYAVKFLDRRYAIDRDMARRCQREARAMAQLANRHIPRAYVVGSTELGDLYIVMEFLRGRDLDQVVRTETLSWQRAATIGLQLCEALSVAHAHNIIHRDVKPANCFLVETGDAEDLVKLIDFGISKDLEATGNLTGTGMILGTPGYLAPEQLSRGASPSPVTDVYSLGVTLFRLMTGRLPWDSSSHVDLAYHQHHTAPKLLSELIPGGPAVLPACADAILMRAFDVDPLNRYPSAKAFASALASALIDTTVPFVRGSSASMNVSSLFGKLADEAAPAPTPRSETRSIVAEDSRAAVSRRTVDAAVARSTPHGPIDAPDEPAEVDAVGSPSFAGPETSGPQSPGDSSNDHGNARPAAPHKPRTIDVAQPQIARHVLFLGVLTLVTLGGASITRPKSSAGSAEVLLSAVAPTVVQLPPVEAKPPPLPPPPPVDPPVNRTTVTNPPSSGEAEAPTSRLPEAPPVRAVRGLLAEQSSYLAKPPPPPVDPPVNRTTVTDRPASGEAEAPTSRLPEAPPVRAVRGLLAEQSSYLAKTCAAGLSAPRIVVTVELKPSGRLQRLDTDAPRQFTDCARRLFRSVRFPASLGGGSVKYTLSLHAASPLMPVRKG